ncbi:hypothetical protein LINGRAPRIM_LOCUS778, partial [Linum grandiflorum]
FETSDSPSPSDLSGDQTPAETSIKPPPNLPNTLLYNLEPSNHPQTRFSSSFLQKSEFGSFALRVRFLAIFRRFSGWLNISDLGFT